MNKITFCITFSLLMLCPDLFAQDLVINELITSNSEVNTDEDDSYEDWIELYNGTAESINLEGYGLSDNDNLFQWVFPAKEIGPGEHLLVWCSDKNRTNPDEPLHTNFKISADGETLSLTTPEGVLADSYMPVIIPQNYSYGRQPDGSGEFVIFPEPTPGGSNITTGYSEILEEPEFSVASGFYEDAFDLSIMSDEPDVTIIYTLDGSEPDENNLGGTTYQYKNQYPENPGDEEGSFLTQSFLTYAYTEPITITNRNGEPNKIATISTTYHSDPEYIPDFPVMKSTTIRAKAVKAGSMPSPVVTANYFISPQGLDWFSMPVAAVNISENLFFDYEEGIYVAGKDFDDWREANPTAGLGWCEANFTRSGDAAEVKGNFSYFVNGEEQINQDVGIRIHGGTTTAYPSKSLRFYARSEYGKSNLEYPFFGGDNDNSFKRLILRNSGNDFGTIYFLDAFIHKSVRHLNFDTQDYQPTITFINGEYWGMLNMRERYDKHYFERVYDIPEDEIDYLEFAGLIEAKEGDASHYNALEAYLENNTLEDEEAYEYVTTQLDPVNFADYYITEIYVNNQDWLANNVELFRKRTETYEPDAPYGSDGRWRWILKDTDVAFGLAGSATHNTLAMATEPNGPSYPNPAWATLSFRKMLENEGFRHYFINRFADLLNTAFLPNRLQDLFDEMKAVVSPEIQGQINRWSAIPDGAWNNYCDAIISFAHQRPTNQRQHIQEEFNIDGLINATLNVSDTEQGYITINTIDINGGTPGVEELPYPWEGIYFHNIPVKLKAQAMPGFEFSHWSGDVTGTAAEVTITATEDFSVMAHFVPGEPQPETTPVYFWVFDGEVPNDTPLTELDATYAATGTAVLQYDSCLEGYPFTEEHPAWRTASMERRNEPTDINYLPEANNGVPFSESGMKAIQVKQPFQDNGQENTLIFNLSTIGYKDVKFEFAAMDEGAADALLIDYSVTGGQSWITTGIEASSLSLSENYQLFEIDFSSVAESDDNEEFRIRIRFEGENMTADNGDRVTFNNISLTGTPFENGVEGNESIVFTVYPNPVSEMLYVKHSFSDSITYSLYSIEGRQVKKGVLQNDVLDMNGLQQGVYLLKLSEGEKSGTVKVIKQ